MKKFFKSLVAIMLIAMMSISFTSCGMPNDPTKTKANLEKEGYSVVYLSDAISLTTQEALFGVSRGGLIGVVTGTNSNGSEMVVVYYCKDSKVAKTVYDKIKAEYDTADAEEKKDTAVGKSGKVVWMGTKAAIKAAK